MNTNCPICNRPLTREHRPIPMSQHCLLHSPNHEDAEILPACPRCYDLYKEGAFNTWPFPPYMIRQVHDYEDKTRLMDSARELVHARLSPDIQMQGYATFVAMSKPNISAPLILMSTGSLKCYHGHWFFRLDATSQKFEGMGLQSELIKTRLTHLVALGVKSAKVRIEPINHVSLHNYAKFGFIRNEQDDFTHHGKSFHTLEINL